MDQFPRSSGVLLHVSSLPGPYGIGDLGQSARDFVDRLVAAQQTYWQILPLGPTGFGDSPYQCLSSSAGNTNLISLDLVAAAGWLTEDELADRPPFRARVVDYPAVVAWHDELLMLAHERFTAQAGSADREAFAGWCASNAGWLEDYVLFISLKETNGGRPWVEWPAVEATYGRAAAEVARKTLRFRLDEHRFRQWLFFTQWSALRGYANQRGIRIIGDIPIFVGHDSCDVWVNPELFDLDERGYPRFVAGVPPDAFSATGQRWGNPLYVWSAHQQTGFDWWIKRVDASFGLYDVVRIDHFRGFDRYWRIAAGDLTAEHGGWQPGPGRALFDALGPDRNARIIAEDLGDDMGGAIALRDELHLPGMVVLQFAFSGSSADRERFLPGKPGVNAVVYSGTHDNNTTLGWVQDDLTPAQLDELLHTIDKRDLGQPGWGLIRLGMSYAAHTFIVPAQDLLGLGESARMNRPSVSGGNWRWRATENQLREADWGKLRELTEHASRARAAPQT
jgi:4-alpha-glucanotransferase